MDSVNNLFILILMHQVIVRATMVALLLYVMRRNRPRLSNRRSRSSSIRYSLIGRMPNQLKNLDKLLNTDCKTRFMMDRGCFVRLCYLLQNVGGLRHSRHVGISEQVAMFLEILAHHSRNRKIGMGYARSGQTVSKFFNRVMLALLKCHTVLLARPDPVGDDEENHTWSLFKGCLGALDGVYVNVKVPLIDKLRYRNCKGDIATNVLAVCDRNGFFVYVLAGWEGSATDSRVLKDAVTRPNGLKVPSGCYYLCDKGYSNMEGFLSPYRGVRYHLNEWESGHRVPQNYQEYFNMKHSKAMNVIERAFGSLKTRWSILRSNAFFPIKTQTHIIMACVLLQNFIRKEMGVDADEDEDEWSTSQSFNNDHDDSKTEFVDVVQPSQTWTRLRDTLAIDMYNQWRSTPQA